MRISVPYGGTCLESPVRAATRNPAPARAAHIDATAGAELAAHVRERARAQKGRPLAARAGAR